MGHDQLSIVEHVMADEAVQEFGQRLAKMIADVVEKGIDLGQRIRQPVRDLHLLASQFAQELDVVIAGDAEGRSRGNHVANNAHGVENPRTAIDQVADEQGPSSGRVLINQMAPNAPRGISRGISVGRLDRQIAQQRQQVLEFVTTTVHVADDVERAMLAGAIVPEGRALDRRRVEGRDALQDEDVAKTLALEPAQRPAELRTLLRDHVRSELAVRPLGVARVAYRFGNVEHNGDRQAVVLAGQRHQGLARFGLHVRGVDHRQPSAGQTLRRDEVQHLERILRGRLIVFVIADKRAAFVGREDLARQEVLARKRALARTAGSDQHDERKFWDLEKHERSRERGPVRRHNGGTGQPRSNTPICVGAPSWSSIGPIGRNRTL
jgi:hypothetical protein